MRCRRCCQNREVELRHIVTARKFDTDGVLSFGFSVVLYQLLANFPGFDADHRIVSRIVIDRAPEHLGPNHPLSQGIDLAFQSMFNDQLEKILGSLAARKRRTR